jgi:hypothetical protein
MYTSQFGGSSAASGKKSQENNKGRAKSKASGVSD